MLEINGTDRILIIINLQFSGTGLGEDFENRKIYGQNEGCVIGRAVVSDRL